jgi:hypothetical protein
VSEPGSHRAGQRRSRLLALQRTLLRLGGLVEMLAFASAVIPRSWMAAAHEWLGMGPFPDAAVVVFMIRQSSFFYGVHGLLLWFLASDVERFQPVVRFVGWAFLSFAPAFFLIDWSSGVPLWWTICDPLACGLFGGAILATDRAIARAERSKVES